MTDAFSTEWTCFDVSLDGHVAHIQLKRPEAMNSMIREFWNELPVIVKDIDHNARARAIVISSTGKHFSAGMDLAVFGGGGSSSANQNQDRTERGELDGQRTGLGADELRQQHRTEQQGLGVQQVGQESAQQGPAVGVGD